MQHNRFVLATLWFVTFLFGGLALAGVLSIEGIGEAESNALGLALLALILGFVGYLQYVATWRSRWLARRAARHGLDADATVLAAEYTGMSVEGAGPERFQVELRVRVEPAGAAAFVARAYAMRHELNDDGRVQPGAKVRVRYLPGNTEEVILGGLLPPALPRQAADPHPEPPPEPDRARRALSWALPAAGVVALPLGLLAGGFAPPLARLALRMACPGSAAAFWSEVSPARTVLVLCEAADGTRTIGDPPVLLLSLAGATVVWALLAATARRGVLALGLASSFATVIFAVSFLLGREEPRSLPELESDGGIFLRGRGAEDLAARIRELVGERRLLDLEVAPVLVRGTAVSEDGAADRFELRPGKPADVHATSDRNAKGRSHSVAPSELPFSALASMAADCRARLGETAARTRLALLVDSRAPRLVASCSGLRRNVELRYGIGGSPGAAQEARDEPAEAAGVVPPGPSEAPGDPPLRVPAPGVEEGARAMPGLSSSPDLLALLDDSRDRDAAVREALDAFEGRSAAGCPPPGAPALRRPAGEVEEHARALPMGSSSAAVLEALGEPDSRDADGWHYRFECRAGFIGGAPRCGEQKCYGLTVVLKDARVSGVGYACADLMCSPIPGAGGAADRLFEESSAR